MGMREDRKRQKGRNKDDEKDGTRMLGTARQKG